ncbi:rpp4 candidate R5, partial [Trifolium medium]|nr:rpp4 candidate R5 [Trifolium medium]
VAADVAEKFVFPCLTSLHLNDLPELAYFYCEIFTLECPELQVLVVCACPRLQLFQRAPLESENEGNITSINRQPLFSNLQVISLLEILSVHSNHCSVLRSSLQPTEVLNFLKHVQMFFDDNEKPTLPFDILNKAPNLREMNIEWCKSLEIFHTPSLKLSEQLKTLTLSNVSELKFIWSKDSSSWLKTVCEKLYSLNVICCPDLTELFCSPSAVSSFYLKELYIENCHGLEYLFPSSVAKVLMHLEKITVKESQSIKNIIEMEQDVTTSLGVKFERLYSITLDSLSSLEYFYSGNDTLQLPSLTLVNIQQCPKMAVFSRGGIDAKSLRGIHNSVEKSDELIFHNDLNVSVKMAFLLQVYS